MIGLPDSIVYFICMTMGLFYAAYLFIIKSIKPNLVDFCVIVTTSFALYTGLELVLNILLNKDILLGQLKTSKLTIILGGSAVIWISITCIIDTFRKNT